MPVVLLLLLMHNMGYSEGQEAPTLMTPADLQFDSSQLESNISEVRVTTLELKSELSKSNQKVQALTQRLESLERRPLARTMTRNQSMARAPSSALPFAGTSSLSTAADLLIAATNESGTTAAESSTAAAPAPSSPRAGVTGPKINFAADTKPAEATAAPAARHANGKATVGSP